MAGKRKRKLAPRDPAEVAQDRFRVLRSKASIQPGHWVTGVAPGECPTCNWPDSVPAPAFRSDVDLEMRAVELGAPAAAFVRGWRAAEAASGVAPVLHPALLEREEEDLDGFNVHPNDDED